MNEAFEVVGSNDKALFTLKIHRGDGMALLGMNWKKGKPPAEFVGFAIEYKEPDGDKFFAVKNRLNFLDSDGNVSAKATPSMKAPIQKFRWVHFPRNAELAGEFVYRVTPVFMNDDDELSYGEAQQVSLELRRETYPGKLNVTFTRGFVASQAFVDQFGTDKDSIAQLLPSKASEGLAFEPTHLDAERAYQWMGFEARSAILELLDEAIADKDAKVCVVAFDLNEPEVVTRLKRLRGRLRVIIDDSKEHAVKKSAETQAQAILEQSAGKNNVKRQHMGNLQHNKMIVVNGPKVKGAIGGSTNYSWRGIYVQNNNALVVRGAKAIKPFLDAFEAYWSIDDNSVASFGNTNAATWQDLGLSGIEAQVNFSPHVKSNAVLNSIAKDIAAAESSLLYSLAFLAQTPGPILESITKLTKSEDIFVYGIADKEVKQLQIRLPNGKLASVNPVALSKSAPEPFKSEPTGGAGVRMHHKFLVVDFDKPTARVYLGSYNFSNAADVNNGENLFLIRDRRVAVSYAIEALRIFDHYHFRVVQAKAEKAREKLFLKKPPRKKGEKPWWQEDYTNPRKANDRQLFS